MKIALLLLIALSSAAESYRILGVFQHPGYSHFITFKNLLRRLAEVGHEVTVISHFPDENPHKNYRDISLRGTLPIWKSMIEFEDFKFDSFFGRIERQWNIIDMIIGIGIESCKVMLQNEDVKAIKRGDFDVMIVEDFSSNCPMGLFHKLQIPYMTISSHVMTPWMMEKLGLIQNPSFVLNSYLSFGYKPSTLETLESLLLSESFKLYYHFYSEIPERKIVSEFLGGPVPPLGLLARNVSLILAGTYFPLTGAFMIPPNVIEVSGIHLSKPKKLPKDLQEYLNKATEGVILFSMGSLIKATSWPSEKVKIFQEAFAKLPQKVLWKWDDDTMDGKPENVRLAQWIPQYDILCHKNVKGFITHAGMAGVIETVSCGVPALALPIFADQFGNAASIRDSGMGLMLKYTNITKKSFEWALKTLLDPKTKASAEKVSAIWNDRPMLAMDTAIYWIEHVARHGGSHLQPVTKDLPLYRYLMLDVISILALTFIFTFYIIIKAVLWIVRRKKEPKLKTN